MRTVLGDPRFSLAEAAIRDVPRLTPQRYGGILIDQDPPDHTRLRRLVTTAFTARRVEQLRGRARQLTAELVDDMVTAGSPADLVAALAVPLPGLMICELIGVPYADRDQFRDWVGAWMSVTALTPEQRGEYIAQLAGYLAELAARMDIETALAAVLERFPDLRLAVAEAEVEWKSGMAVRGPVTLPITW